MTTEPDTSPDTRRVEDAARALLDDRITAVRHLAAARQHRTDKQAELLEAERADATAYAAAQRAGWSADELRRLGFPEPARKAPGRPRRTRITGDHGSTDGSPDGAPDAPSPLVDVDPQQAAPLH